MPIDRAGRTQLCLTFPKPLVEEFRAAVKTRGRTLTGELTVLIGQYLGGEEIIPAPPLDRSLDAATMTVSPETLAEPERI